jgi:hypothetical protein
MAHPVIRSPRLRRWLAVPAAAIALVVAACAPAVALVCGIDLAALAPQMEAAKQAGMKVVDMHLADVSEEASPLIAGQTNGQFNDAMRMGVAAALVDVSGGVATTAIELPDISPEAITTGAYGAATVTGESSISTVGRA